jgi:hypothetical protein
VLQRWQLVTIQFAFPFFGVNRAHVWAGSNGGLNLDSGEQPWAPENVAAFNNQARIAAFFDDLNLGEAGVDYRQVLYVNEAG